MNKNKIYKHIKNLGFSPKVIVDCGAAWGEWSSLIKSIFNDSTIIAIDSNKWHPNKEIPGADITEIATLSDKDYEEMVFYQKKENLDNGTFCTGDSLFKENSHHYDKHNTVTRKVSTITLKTLLNKYNYNVIDLLKIDTQGSELIIMKGLMDILNKTTFIELECSVIEYNIGGCSLFQIIDFLKNQFDIYEICGLHYHNNRLAQIDIIFKNKDYIFI